MFHPPLSERISRSIRPGTPPKKADGRGTYKQYSSDKLALAVKAYYSEKLTIGRTAEQFGVPKTTLYDRLKGRTTKDSHSGPRRYLSDEEEATLVSFIINSAEIGYGKSQAQIISIVQRVVDKKGLEVKVSGGWWDSFRQRHPNICLQSAEKLSYIRSVASSPTILDRYYDLLQATLEDNDLLEKPCQIFNLDESGMPLDPAPLKVACAKGAKHARAITTGNKKQVTILAACSAGGSTIPPLVIYARKTLTPELTVGEVPGTRYGLSPNGWIDAEIFEDWFKQHFLTYAPPIRPLLVLLDGHSSHFSPTFVEKAAGEKIIIFCLPPHTTHITQPLDKGCYGPLKMAWRQECQNFLASNPGKVITIYQFNTLFHKAWDKAMTPGNIRAGFSVTGVYPLDRFAGRKLPEKQSLAEKSGIAFIPLFTPRKSRPVSEHHLLQPESGDELPEVTQRVQPSTHKSALSKVLQHSELAPPHKPNYEPRSSARVLTSADQRKLLQEKEKMKAKKLAEKELRKKQREQKRQEKACGAPRTKKPLFNDVSLSENIDVHNASQESSMDNSNFLTGCVITCAGVSAVECKTIQELCESRGGCYSEHFLKNECTHLLVRDTDTETYSNAVEWGMCTIYPEWLYDCVRASCLLCETGYYAIDDMSEGDILAVGCGKEVTFSASELELFQRRYDEGYDLPPTGRYLLWLQRNQPKEVGESNGPPKSKCAGVQASRKTRLTSSTAVGKERSSLGETTTATMLGVRGGRGKKALSSATNDDNENADTQDMSKASRKTRLTSSTAVCKEKSSLGGLVQGETITTTKLRARGKGSSRKRVAVNGGTQDTRSDGSANSQDPQNISRVLRKTRVKSSAAGGRRNDFLVSCKSTNTTLVSSSSASDSTNNQDFKLMCVAGYCHNPEAEDWICCDECASWYHCSCVGVSLAAAQDVEFICCDC